jgi:restriction endonuclease S subunit
MRWQTKTLGDCCTLTSGGTPSKGNARFWVGDVPFVSARDLKFDRIDTAVLHISHEAVEQSATKLAPVGSLLMLVRGMGLANGIQVGEVTAPVAFNQDIRAIHPPSASVLPRFLLLALRNTFTNGEGWRVLSSAAHGTLKIDTDALRQVTVPLPPIREQQRIVGILDKAFGGIATAKDNAEKNLQKAWVLFESHLQSVFAQRGKGWEEEPIGSVAEVFDGPHATPKTIGTGPVFLGISALQDGRINLGETRHVTPEDFQRWTRRVKPQTDDIVFSYETRLGQAAIIPSGLQCCLGRRMGLVRVNRKRLDPRFFVHQYISAPFREFLAGRTVRGATVDRIPLREFPSFPIKVPRLEEQERMADQFETLREETQRLAILYERKLAALDTLKKSLLHQAFTGQL